MRTIELKEMKERLVEMTAYLDKLCDENGLTLFMSGGTLLGAVRHKGFIPWDDDVDMYMSRPDYDKLIEIFRKEGNNGRYKLLCHELEKDYGYMFAKLVDTNTVLIERNADCGVEMGLYVDVFPIDGLGNSIKDAKKIMKRLRPYRYMNISLSLNPWGSKNFIKDFAYAVIRIAAKMLGKEKIHQKMSDIVHETSYDDSTYVGEIIDYLQDKRIMLKSEMYESYELMEFENIKLKAPKNWDKWLTQFYGDYMTLPPEEERVLKHGFKLYEKTSED